jgi:hypothetical protein
MSTDIDDAALDFLLVRAGLSLTPGQKTELKTVYAGIAAMAERVRQPRGRMAEPAHIYGFAEEDLR